MQNLFKVNKNRLKESLELLFLNKNADCKLATALTYFSKMFHFYTPLGFQGLSKWNIRQKWAKPNLQRLFLF